MEAARLADDGDIERLVEIAATVIAELAPGRGGPQWRRVEQPELPAISDLAAYVDASDRVLIAGTIDEQVFGLAAMAIAATNDGPLARVEGLAVLPEAREVGVGEAMMDLALDWARARGCWGVDATVLPGNRSAKNFFESFGLVARLITVHRSLESVER